MSITRTEAKKHIVESLLKGSMCYRNKEQINELVKQQIKRWVDSGKLPKGDFADIEFCLLVSTKWPDIRDEDWCIKQITRKFKVPLGYSYYRKNGEANLIYGDAGLPELLKTVGSEEMENLLNYASKFSACISMEDNKGNPFGDDFLPFHILTLVPSEEGLPKVAWQLDSCEKIKVEIPQDPAQLEQELWEKLAWQQATTVLREKCIKLEAENAELKQKLGRPKRD